MSARILSVFLLLSTTTPSAFPQPQWSRVGPYGGYIRSLATDTGGNIYAATYLGGIYESTNKGAFWNLLFDDTLKADFRSVAVNADGDIFAGTDGLGLHRSTDGGSTWQQRGIFFTASTVVQALLILSNGDLLAGTLSGNTGVYRSTDEGESFSFISTGLTNRSVYTLAVNPDGDLFAGTAGGGIFRSTDDGAHWSAINTGIGTSDMFIFGLTAAAGDSLWAATGSGLYRSADNGDTWTAVHPIPTAGFSGIAIAPNGDLYAAATSINSAIGGGVFRSTDAGTTWTQEPGLPNVAHEAIVVSGSSLFAGTAGPGVYRVDSAAASWTKADSGMANTHVFVLEQNAAGVFYAGTRYAGAFSSVDSGKTWTSIENGLPHDWINAIAVNPLNNDLYLATNSLTFRSTNDGTSWQQVRNNGATALACNTNGLILAGIGAQVSRSTNDGTTWSGVNIFPVSNIAGIAFGVPDSIVYVATGNINGTGGQGVYRSTDAGVSYAPFNDGLTNLNVTAIATSDRHGSCPAITAGTKGDGEFALNELNNQWGSSGLAGTSIRYLRNLIAQNNTIHLGAALAFLFARNATCIDDVLSLFATTEPRCITGLISEPAGAAGGSGGMSLTLLVGTNGRGIFRASDVQTAVTEEQTQRPSVTLLGQNYPNPFNPKTTITYDIPATMHVSLVVIDMLGRKVATLVNADLPAGSYASAFDGSNRASGVYFYRLEAGSRVQTRKLILMR